MSFKAKLCHLAAGFSARQPQAAAGMRKSQKSPRIAKSSRGDQSSFMDFSEPYPHTILYIHANTVVSDIPGE